jgi:hypothetical protein
MLENLKLFEFLGYAGRGIWFRVEMGCKCWKA